MDNSFEMKSEVRQGALIIKTAGYINNKSGEQIADVCYNHMDEGVKTIIMDVEKSKVVNSMGISILLEILDKLDDINGKLIMTNLSSTIDKALTIMGVFKYAHKAETVADALSV